MACTTLKHLILAGGGIGTWELVPGSDIDAPVLRGRYGGGRRERPGSIIEMKPYSYYFTAADFSPDSWYVTSVVLQKVAAPVYIPR